MANWSKAARTLGHLDRLIEPAQGCALLVDVRTRQLIAAHRAPVAAGELAPPGSTLKPFALQALLHSGKLKPDDSLFCTGTLKIGPRSFNCSHPRIDSLMRISTALAYSCNCFVGHFAARFERGELALALDRAGLASLPGLVGPAEVTGRVTGIDGADANRLQALGEESVLVTTAGLAIGYRGLALNVGHPEMNPLLEGLEGATEYGTARLASTDSLKRSGVKVAGKTGSVRARSGARIAWFAGFAPSRAPEVVVVVMLQGRSGGADAAPVAGRILEAWESGNI